MQYNLHVYVLYKYVVHACLHIHVLLMPCFVLNRSHRFNHVHIVQCTCTVCACVKEMPPEVCLLPLEEARHAGARVSLQLPAELQNVLHCNSLVGHHVHQGMFLGERDMYMYKCIYNICVLVISRLGGMLRVYRPRARSVA